MDIAEHSKVQWQLLPDLAEEEYEALKADIAERGVLIPVEYDEEGNVLDGHHRVDACEELGITDWPSVARGGMDDAAKRRHVRAVNLARRHLSREQQRVVIADALRDDHGRSNRKHARDLGVDHKTVQSVREELEARGEVTHVSERTDSLGRQQPARRSKPDPEPEPERDGEWVDGPPPEPEAGPVSVFATDERSRRKATDAAANLAESHAGQTLDANTARKAASQRKKRERHDEIASREPPELTGTYDVLYVDPPWQYEHAEPTRQVENHYPTMGAAELAALEVPANEDAVLLMWATSPKLGEAFDLLNAWGFEYRTSMVWVKDRIGMGYYARQRHEFLLIAKRGSPATPEPSARPDSVIEAPRAEHSAKPPMVYDLIESMWPHASKVELFARSAREGWASWGKEAGDPA